MKSFAILLVSVATLAVPGVAQAGTWHVPSECLTIQAGIDSAGYGDTVLVACGTYTLSGEGTATFEGLIRMKSGVCLRSETGLPDCVIIDAEHWHRPLYCENVDDAARIEGFTLTGGDTVDVGAGILLEKSSPTISDCRVIGNSCDYYGGGVFCQSGDPALVRCEISGNSSGWRGGGLYIRGCSPSLTRCEIHDNGAADFGGGLHLSTASPSFDRCTISHNSAGTSGGGIYAMGSSWSGETSSPTLHNTIIAFSTEGEAVWCDELSTVTFTCCDVYGNAGGDSTDCIVDQFGVNGNIGEDPLFCEDCLYLQDCSLCLEGFGCGQIGAYGVGCPCGGGPSVVKPGSWSSIKALYR